MQTNGVEFIFIFFTFFFFFQILHIFNRKVHPENATTWQQSHKPIKNETKNNGHAQFVASYSEGLLRPSAEDIIIYPQQSNYNKHPHLPAKTCGGDAAGNELWVKTDADCK